MLTTAPHLHVRRPSPTTAEFIVTTCPPLTVPLRLLLATVFLLRIVLGVGVGLLLYSKWALSRYATPFPADYDIQSAPPLFSDAFIWHAVWTAHASPAGESLTQLAARTPAWALLPACAALLYVLTMRIHTTESLLVLRGLGIQTSSTGATYLAAAGTRFIPTEKIRDVLINEAFRGFEVRYYLVVVVEGEEDVVVVFPKLLPRRKIVETVWRGVRGALYEPDAVRRLDEKGVC